MTVKEMRKEFNVPSYVTDEQLSKAKVRYVPTKVNSFGEAIDDLRSCDSYEEAKKLMKINFCKGKNWEIRKYLSMPVK